MTGPIRPSEKTVIDTVCKMKHQIPNCKVHICTWKSEHTLSELRKHVHTLVLLDPLTDEDIAQRVTTRNNEYQVSILEGREQLAKMRYGNTYRMFYGVNKAIESIVCQDDDIVLRTRTDCVILFEPSYVQSLLERAKAPSYIVRFRKSSGCMFDDWFAITTYKILKDVWCMTLEEYNHLYNISLNAEDIVRRRTMATRVSIVRIDENKAESFLYREDNMTRHYLE